MPTLTKFIATLTFGMEALDNRLAAMEGKWSTDMQQVLAALEKLTKAVEGIQLTSEDPLQPLFTNPPLLDSPPSEHHQIVSASSEPNLILEDTMETVSIVDVEDSDEVDFGLNTYSNLVLSKHTASGIIHIEIISNDSSSIFVSQASENEDENEGLGIGTSLISSLNFCIQCARQNAYEMLIYSLPNGKPPPLPPEVARNLVIYHGDPTKGANTMTSMRNFLKTVDVAAELKDLVHSGIVPKHKVDLDDKSELEMFRNYEVPQGIFNKLRITKRNEGIRLMIENWKFMPWVKRYSDSYDMFLADKWIILFFPQLLEEQLYMRRKIPVVNNLTHMTWNGLIREEAGSRLFYSRIGTSMVKVSRGSFNVKEIIENMMYVIVGIIHLVSNKWKGLMAIHLQLSESLSVHICQTLLDWNLKVNGAERIEKKMLEKGEVTNEATKYEIVRKESSKNSSMYGVRYMIIKMNSLVYFLVKVICKKEFKITWQHVWGRCHNSSGSFVNDRQISIMFTHHQKIVVIDHEMLNEVSANASKCSPGVGQNASMNYSSYFMMRANSNGYIMVPAMKVDDSSVLLMNTCHYYEEESSLLSFLQLWEGNGGVQKFLYLNGVAGSFVFDKGKVHKYNKKNDLKIYKGSLPVKSQQFRISDFSSSPLGSSPPLIDFFTVTCHMGGAKLGMGTKITLFWREVLPGIELINKQKLIWLSILEEIIKEDCALYYEISTKDWEDHIFVKHFSAKGQLEFKAMMFVPITTSFNLFDTSKKIDVYKDNWNKTKLAGLLLPYFPKSGDEMQDLMPRRQITKFKDVTDNFMISFLSTRAEGFNIYFISGDTHIPYNSDWNPQMDLQVAGIYHMISQTKQIYVYRLATTPSVEERILQRAFTKLMICKGQFQQDSLAYKVDLYVDDIKHRELAIVAYTMRKQLYYLIGTLSNSKKLVAAETDGSKVPNNFGIGHSFVIRVHMGNTYVVFQFETAFFINCFSLVDPTFLVCFVNKFCIFSSPRPPEVDDLEDKVILKKGGMMGIKVTMNVTRGKAGMGKVQQKSLHHCARELGQEKLLGVIQLENICCKLLVHQLRSSCCRNGYATSARVASSPSLIQI